MAKPGVAAVSHKNSKPAQPVSVKVSAHAAKPAVASPVKASVQALSAKKAGVAAKPVIVAVKSKAAGPKPVIAVQHKAAAQHKAVAVKAVAVKAVAPAKPAGKAPATQAKAVSEKPDVTPDAEPKTEASVEESKPDTDNKQSSKDLHFEGRRDPFLSPVVNMAIAGGSGCSSGKRCLSIDQIALKGILKSEAGMIAVVVNSLDKAYFLRENDPVFNGYVEKITGDSIVFKETFHDRLGKPLTRDVTKTITRPAV
jgi:hypothetical protein